MPRFAPWSVALVVASAVLSSTVARADDAVFNEPLRMVDHNPTARRASSLRASAVPTDTVYVGYTPGRFSPTKNWWSIGSGHGAGYHRPPTQGGMWDWEPTGGAYLHGDSLQGWWPDRAIMNGTGGYTLPDWQRPWWAIDIGNKANYRLNASGRTYGVIGVWHRDDFGAPTNAGSGTKAPAIAPIGGSYSAWMGLRAHGDMRFTDAITGQPFNEGTLIFSVPGSATATGSDNGFPGYGSQMDQMLYREIDMTGNTERDLTVSYSYRICMATGFGTAAGTRTGWFDKDPLQATDGGAAQTAASLNNFISSSDAGNAGAPRDSFMVYIGAPVEGTFKASTGVTLPVFDPQRRWLDEVVRANETGLYKELGADTGRALLRTKSVTIPNAVLAPMLAASGDRVRLVFRVKTNRGFDDQGTAFSSGGAGAAVVDDVTYQMVGGPGSPAGWGDFEADGSIDNTVGVDAWKSTGKPPGHYMHPAELSTLQYDDICGQPGDVSRACNLGGVVLSLGDFDNGEAASGLTPGTADREAWQNLISPSIQLRSDNGSWPNPLGLSEDDANATDDYYIDYEIYTGVVNPFTYGVMYRFGMMSYPARGKAALGGYPTWGNVRYLAGIIFDTRQECLRQMFPAKGFGILGFDNARSERADRPDSVRIVLGNRQECYRFGVTTGCSSSEGNYWDNISLAIIDGGPEPIYGQIWDLYQDTFPANETPGLPGVAAAFDTTSALIKSGLNTAPNSPTRFDVPGDSVAITTYGGPSTRVDLVFRILPGPGNYVTLGRPDLGTLRKVPSSMTPIGAPSITSSNFWESYLADNGPKGTPGGHVGAQWNPNVWNSARMDTTEVAIFAFQGRGIEGAPRLPIDPYGNWQTTYHESELGIAPDPHTETGGDPYLVTNTRASLGIARSRCFLATANAATTNVICNGTVPAYVGTSGVPNPATGFDGTVTTIENTKIIPDGLLTPGAHVQYFFRSEVGGVLAGIMPDTNVVFPQYGEGSSDGHRWQQFGVLPDRWKDPAYRHPVLGSFGLGSACMLVVDNNDRRGNERVWVSIADTIGATSSAKRGAHNGWAARGDRDVNDPSGFVSAHGGQPGTSWDLYQVKASEALNTNSGSIGSRLSYHDPANTQINGKSSRQGPTPEMLSAFYHLMLFMSGDLNSGILGPFTNKTSDDVGILHNWLQSGDPLLPNRGLWAIGDGFVESLWEEEVGSPQVAFSTDVLGVALRNASYGLETGNTETTPDLYLSTVVTGSAGAGDVLGVRNHCLWTNDVLDLAPALLGETFVAAAYEAAGPGPLPIAASVIKRHTPQHPWIAMVDGFDLANLTGRYDINSNGRLRYFYDVLTNVFGAVCTTVGTPLVVLDVPSDLLLQARDFLQLDNNPVRNRLARVRFGVARAGRVEVALFDIAGRLVRTLADRNFPAGEHSLTWDGRNNDGLPAARGVYFARIRTPGTGFEASRKLTLLQ